MQILDSMGVSSPTPRGKYRPILMGEEQVPALWDGKKTQERRLVHTGYGLKREWYASMLQKSPPGGDAR